jgi:REP element-mobilizing transposase RayT
MGRSRYKFHELHYPYFITSSVVKGLPLFMHPALTHIILEGLLYMQQENKVILNAYVIMPNHIHLIAEHEQLPDMLARFKSFTARSIVDHLKDQNRKRYLSLLKFGKLKHHRDSEHQVWQEGLYPKQLFTADMVEKKMNYIHFNPVKAGFVDSPNDWRYSSARNYAGLDGVIPVNRFGE